MAYNLFTLVLMFLLWQCNKYEFGELMEEAQFEDTFLLEEGRQIKVVGKQEALVLQFNAVNDSRCPANAICAWMGNATVALTASNSQEKNKLIELCIGDCRSEPVRSKHTRRVEVGGKVYNITLKEVLPYPGLEKEKEMKQAKLMVQQE